MCKKILIGLLVIVVTFAVILTAAKTVVFDHDAHVVEFEKLFIDNSELLDYTLLGYFQDLTDVPSQFTDDEQDHLKDVKDVIQKGEFVLMLSILLIIVLLAFLLQISEITDVKYIIRWSGVLLIAIPILFTLINFSTIFTNFHLIFFPQGNWQFAADSLLIQTYPLQFFWDMVFRIGIHIIAVGVFFVILSSEIIRTKTKAL